MDSIQLSNNGHASWAHHMSTALGQLCIANQTSFLQGTAAQTNAVVRALYNRSQQNQYSSCVVFGDTPIREVSSDETDGFKTYVYSRWFEPVSCKIPNYTQ